MGELVLNEVEGKEFSTIKMVCFRFYPIFQYSSIPWKRHKSVAIKRSLISNKYIISEMLICNNNNQKWRSG